MITEEETGINRYIGIKLYEARIAAGYSLNDLAQKICVKEQQLLKYENGTNQLSISKLLKIAEVLSLNIEYFIGDIKPTKWNEKTAKDQKLCLSVSNSFMQIKDKACQKLLSDVIKILSKKYK